VEKSKSVENARVRKRVGKRDDGEKNTFMYYMCIEVGMSGEREV
jgi:hypothetical protein